MVSNTVMIVCVLWWAGSADQPLSPYHLSTMPQGYQLQSYDDCGVLDRQPHVQTRQTHVFARPHEVQADDKACSVAWEFQELKAVYAKLDPSVPYAVAIVYANETFNPRVQSLWADDVQLHGPHPLPRGGAERLLFKIPPEVVRDGRFELRFKLEGPVNVVVSAIESWAPKPSPKIVYVTDVTGFGCDPEGRVLNLACDPLPGAEVALLRQAAGQQIAGVVTDGEGRFRFPRTSLASVSRHENLVIRATHEGAKAERVIAMADLVFQPVRYRPLPTKAGDLARPQILLDGTWRICPKPAGSMREQPLDGADWSDFKVPGQFVQQDYDIPKEQATAVATEFAVPAEWAGHRVILRFDAIHAATRYFINGKPIGESETLFTPVEWDISDHVKPGRTNRLDLEMKVDSVSEQLSYASGYAFHNLGGVDRSVRLFALPPVHVRALRLAADFDVRSGDGELKIEAVLDNASAATIADAVVSARLLSPEGRALGDGTLEVRVPSTEAGTRKVRFALRVPGVQPWCDEKPNLYRMELDLQVDGRLVERIERSVGFRRIEVRDRQVYVNDRRIKLAGVCRHETHPLTGRADTMRWAETDLRLLKEANLNYVRTSHYPPPQELLDAADRLGIYVEVEAPFCWVRQSWGMETLRQVLPPTSAMIDYHHWHPSVLLWSLANESAFCRFFESCNKLCKELDPTRPTTFNNPDPQRVCDIANAHYPPMPYDAVAKDDPRPLLLGEYFFPVCHEQTDVRINPGLRELWGHGHSAPDSEYGKACAALYVNPPYLLPGAPPGFWPHILQSKQLVGGAIWALLDEPFYLPGDKKVGYAWVHGYWGLVDGWRRTKPEWWLAKCIFSPVWFPQRQVESAPGQKEIRLPVENRHVFTDLSELVFLWQASDKSGVLAASVPPGSSGQIVLPVPADAKPGDEMIVRVTDRAGRLITAAAIRLGPRPQQAPPEPTAGAPQIQEDGSKTIIRGDAFTLVLDRTTGDLVVGDSRHNAPLQRFPLLHLTRYDFGYFAGPQDKPYAVLPEAGSRQVESVSVEPDGQAVRITVRDRYSEFVGTMVWRLDRKGVGEISCEYVFGGELLKVREVGLMCLLKKECDELRWRRWSEWGVFPDDSISRTVGRAKARRDAKWPDQPESRPPDWPWSLDQTELGTNDFRSVKLNVYEASLVSPAGAGLRANARADIHVRSCLSPEGVKMHLLSQCRIAPVILKRADRVATRCSISVLPGKHTTRD